MTFTQNERNINAHVISVLLTYEIDVLYEIHGGSEKNKQLTISVFSVSQGSVEALIR